MLYVAVPVRYCVCWVGVGGLFRFWLSQVDGPFTWTKWTEPTSETTLPSTTTTGPAEQLSVTFDQTECVRVWLV